VWLLEGLTGIDGTVALILVGFLVAGESAALIGLFTPGEVALLTAGALAALGRLPLVVALIVTFAAANVGGIAGYTIGRCWGARLLAQPWVHRRVGHRVPQVKALLEERGMWILIGSRWAGALRALVPLLAGATAMPLPRYLAGNFLGALPWGPGLVLGGYLAGRSVDRLESWLGWWSVAVVAVVVVAVAVAWWRRRRRAALASRPAVWRG
jgi:membrane-associated protein